MPAPWRSSDCRRRRGSRSGRGRSFSIRTRTPTATARDRRVEWAKTVGSPPARAVEDRDRRGDRDRRLFGELDDGAAEALADDRPRAELARLRHRRRLQLGGSCSRQPARSGPTRACRVRSRSSSGRGGRRAVDRAELPLPTDRDRRVAAPRQRRRREAAFADGRAGSAPARRTLRAAAGQRVAAATRTSAVGCGRRRARGVGLPPIGQRTCRQPDRASRRSAAVAVELVADAAHGQRPAPASAGRARPSGAGWRCGRRRRARRRRTRSARAPP